jgi:membrane-associated protease RseP (regulator of RpoE activity)
MGHYIASRRRNIVTSWPYFIPAPNLIGTFGAVIKSKSPFWSRRDLIEVGAAGPIAGWLVALCWLWYGLSQSGTMSLELIQPGIIPFMMEGESIIMRLSTWLLVGSVTDGQAYYLSEAAFAGWVGLLVTAINMLPIGMLDGGHVVYGLLKRRQHLLGKLAVLGLLGLGFWTPMWWLFAAFGLFLGMNHPPTLDDRRPLSRTSKIMGWVALVILLLSFTPVPFR